MKIALVLAGGIGSRMGQGIPKQFIHVQDKPIIIHTLFALQKHSEIDRIHVVCINGWEDVLAAYAKQFKITKLTGISAGGGTRYESTHAGMLALGNVQDDDIIILHDAVRPLVTAATLSDVVTVCQKHGNAMAVMPCTDTMYSRSGTVADSTSKMVDRQLLVRGQTPEAVTGKRMKEMYQKAEKENLQNDSISALQIALGWDVYFACGSERNLKLTRSEDIELFKALLTVQKDEWLK